MVAKETLSTIAGDFALNQDATKDPFAESESAIMANVSKYMTERDSARKEQLASTGFNIGSSFHAAQGIKEEEGILSNVYQSFANARQQEELNARAADRQLIQAGVSAELEKERMAASTANQTELMKKQAELNYGTDESGNPVTAYQAQINTMTEQHKLGEISADEAAKRTKGLMDKEAMLAYGFDEETGKVLSGLDAEIASIDAQQRAGSLTADEAFARQMGSIVLDNDGNPVLDENGKPKRTEGLIERQTIAQVDFLKAQVQQGNLSAESAYLRTYGSNDPNHLGEWKDDNGNWHISIARKQTDQQIDVLTKTNNENLRRMFGDDVLNEDGSFNKNFKASENGQGEIAAQFYYTNKLQAASLKAQTDAATTEADGRFYAALATAGIEAMLSDKGIGGFNAATLFEWIGDTLFNKK